MFGTGSNRVRVCLALALALTMPALALAADTVKKPTTAAPAAGTKTEAKAADAKPQGDAAHQAAMEQMAKLAQPGTEHAFLKTMEGTWKAVTKSWFAPGEPVVTEGTSVNSMILGGRYLQSHYTGTMMGQPFEGWGLTGYDNGKKQYSSFWVDNASTAMMLSNGTMSGKELTTKTIMDGPDGKPTEFRMVTTIVDDKTHQFSMYAPMDGKEQKMMEITYSRP